MIIQQLFVGKVGWQLWQGEKIREGRREEKSFVAHDCELWETEKILSVKMSENLTFLVFMCITSLFALPAVRYKVMHSPCAAVCCADEWICEIFSQRDITFCRSVGSRRLPACCQRARTVNSHLHAIINTLTQPSRPHSCGIEEVTGTRALNKLASWSSTAQKCRSASL